MYLKALDVNGFKSFADKINLEFDSGITAIVGPNGSGKSNVSDAIRWVLGEQSVKSLRGSRMEDIIFAGTQKRSPMGFAQVSISFDNKDGFFNSEFEEIKVTRKLHRSGESEYRINNNPCRLRDIHELFMDTGLGREGYSVIGQGKIDQILSSKAEERRHIFEEASGITKYKYRKAEAEKKLLAADDNLLRIKDLISALSDQVGPLENQSRKARQYLDLREVLKGLEINISIRNIDKMRQQLAEGQEKFTIAFNQLNSEKAKLHDIENAIETKTNELVEINESITAVREELFNVEKGSGNLESRIEILRNDSRNNTENSQRWTAEAEALKERIETCKNQKNELESAAEKLRADKENISKRIEDKSAELERLDTEINKRLEEVENFKSEIVDLLSEISSIKARSTSMDVLLKNFDERKESLKTDLANKKSAGDDIAKRLEALKNSLEENSGKKKKALDDMEILKKDYFEVAGKLDTAKKQQNEFITKLNEKQSRKNILEDLEKGYEGYAKSVKSVLGARMPGVEGVVSKLLEVRDEYITAIEIALGNMLQNIVVTDEEAAKKCIAYLKNNKIGRATFLPLTSVKGELVKNPPVSDKGYVGIASELIGYDAKYDGIFKSLLGRTVIADNIDNATAMAKKSGYRLRIVTLDGQLLNPGGSMTGGSTNHNQSLLSRARDIEQLREEIASMRKQSDKTDDLIADYKAAINKMAEKKQELEDIIRSCEHEDVRLRSQINSDERGLNEITKSIEMLTGESGDIINEIADIDKQKEGFKKEIMEKEEKIRSVREFLSKLEGEGADLTEQRESFAAGITEDKITVGAIDKDLEMIAERSAQTDENILSYEKEIEARNTDIAAIADKNAQIEEEIKTINKRISDAKTNSKSLYYEIEQGEKQYAKGQEDMKKTQQSLKEQNAIIYDLQQEVVRLESKNAKYESDTENVINKLWEDYELTYNTALEFKKTDFNMPEAQREAASLRGKIKALGNINIDAIEQYKEVKEKFDYLTEQKKDLDETKEKLEDIIKELQTEMVSRFNEAFAIIREKFDETFRALFGGGMGKLTLSEPDNVLESGIEIEVQPPGKKLQNMMALSGGERALSAIALLFSVLEVRPTPFCILDEVEAALDDNNVYRFADYIKKYSKKTQFIVVTHRRGTMEAADIMYGVTMQERGISKLLKLKFEDLEDYTTDGA
ncbi:MAG: chromosome segregation protein SMC [Clostridia bacterium]|nr:chromosome segregation protein SMC [Clostridia bacterium]